MTYYFWLGEKNHDILFRERVLTGLNSVLRNIGQKQFSLEELLNG